MIVYFRKITDMEIDFPREELSLSRKRREICLDDNKTTNVKVNFQLKLRWLYARTSNVTLDLFTL